MLGLGLSIPAVAVRQAGGSSLAALLESLYGNGEQGAFYVPKPQVLGQQVLFQDAAGTTPVTSDGDPVGLMLDLSGNDNHATQEVSGSRPVYRTDGQYHWLAPDGVDDFMRLGQALNYEDFTAIQAIRTSGTNERVLDNRGTGRIGAVRGWQMKSRNTTDTIIVDDGSDNYWRWDYVLSDELYAVQTLAYGGSQGSVYVNGSSITPSSTDEQMGSILSEIDGVLFTAANSHTTQRFSGRFYGAIVAGEVLLESKLNPAQQYLASITPGVTL